MVATTSELPIFVSTVASARTHAPLTRFSRKRHSCAASDVGMSISTSACRISTRRKAARSASPSAHSAGRASGRISSENSRGACEAEIVNDRCILRAGRRATALMQKYHTRADSVHERAFAAPLGFCPLLFCAAHHISRNAATCRRMPSLGVSSLDSGRSSERPPFFENPLCNVRKRAGKGGQGGSFRPSLTFYVCNTDPFGAKALQGSPASQSSAHGRLVRETTSESPQFFGRGAHPPS